MAATAAAATMSLNSGLEIKAHDRFPIDPVLPNLVEIRAAFS